MIGIKSTEDSAESLDLLLIKPETHAFIRL